MSMNESWRTAAEEASWAHYYEAPLGWYAHGRNVLHHLPLLWSRSCPQDVIRGRLAMMVCDRLAQLVKTFHRH